MESLLLRPVIITSRAFWAGAVAALRKCHAATVASTRKSCCVIVYGTFNTGPVMIFAIIAIDAVFQSVAHCLTTSLTGAVHSRCGIHMRMRLTCIETCDSTTIPVRISFRTTCLKGMCACVT